MLHDPVDGGENGAEVGVAVGVGDLDRHEAGAWRDADEAARHGRIVGVQSSAVAAGDEAGHVRPVAERVGAEQTAHARLGRQVGAAQQAGADEAVDRHDAGVDEGDVDAATGEPSPPEGGGAGERCGRRRGRWRGRRRRLAQVGRRELDGAVDSDRADGREMPEALDPIGREGGEEAVDDIQPPADRAPGPDRLEVRPPTGPGEPADDDGRGRGGPQRRDPDQVGDDEAGDGHRQQPRQRHDPTRPPLRAAQPFPLPPEFGWFEERPSTLT